MPREMPAGRWTFINFLLHVIVRRRGEASAKNLGIFRKNKWFIIFAFLRLWTL